MLRPELQEYDIPSRSTVKRRVEELFEHHLSQLEQNMSVSINIRHSIGIILLKHHKNLLQHALGKISYTMDMWSDPNMSPFMAVTANWIGSNPDTPHSSNFVSLKLQSELIGFVNVPERHTGEHLAESFLYVLDRVQVTHKV
jgi:hypothetical protein